MKLKALLFLPYFILFIGDIHSKTIYVDAGVQGGNTDGTSWGNAYPDLTSGIMEAVYGDTVWVARGTYFPTTGSSRFASFTLFNGIRLFGGFAGTETSLTERDWQANPTVLSGDIGVVGDSTDNAYTVVYCDHADSTTVLDGFTITGGNADSQSGSLNSARKSGGGMYLVGDAQTGETRPVIANCTFATNSAVSNGGGLFLRTISGNGATPYLKGCVFQDNTAGSGGGVYKDSGSDLHEMFLDSCSFERNRAAFGGGMAYYNNDGERGVVLRGCRFEGNSALQTGGVFIEVNNGGAQLRIVSSHFEGNFSDFEGSAVGYFFFADSEVWIDSCTFVANCTQSGGTIVAGFSGTVHLENSTFLSNIALNPISPANGGCIYVLGGSDFMAVNCLFARSRAGGGGVAYLAGTGTLAKFVNCTFFANEAEEGLLHCQQGILAPGGFSIINSVFFENNTVSGSPLIWGCNESEASISHSLVVAGDCAGLANIPVSCGPGMVYTSDPMFADTVAGDFSLLPCSAAIDAGDNAALAGLGVDTDLAGNPRIGNGKVDMGAYEALLPSLDMATVAQPACGGAGGSVDFLISYGCPPYSYAWSGSNGIGSGREGLDPGDYSFTITDANGHTVTAMITVPEVPAVTIIMDAVPYDCSGTESGTAVVTPTGGTPPFGFFWENGATDSLLNGLLPDNYSATVTDANGCTAATEVEVGSAGLLPVTIAVTPYHCQGSNDGTAAIVPLGGISPFSWLWQDGGTDSLRSGLGSENYSVTITDGIGCTDEIMFSLIASDSLIIDPTATDVLCAGHADGTASAGAMGGSGMFAYAWSNGGNTSATGQLTSGWYGVTVTDTQYGCTGTASVVVGSPEELLLSVEATDTLCFGANDGVAAAISSGGVPPYVYSWDNGSVDSLATGLGPGTASITVTDANSCQQEFLVQFSTYPEITAQLDTLPATGPGSADGSVTIVALSGGSPEYSFLWSNGGTGQSIENVPPGDYSVTVTDSNGCQGVFEASVDFLDSAGEGLAFYVETIITPNPSGGGRAQLWLETAGPEKLRLWIFDWAGKKVYTESVGTLQGRNNLWLPAGLSKGIYLVWLENREGRKKILKWAVQ
jgi:hypothetical protein